jgi:hypothetical protein
MTQGNDRRRAATNAGISVDVSRPAPRTTPTLPYGPRSGPSRLGRYTTSDRAEVRLLGRLSRVCLGDFGLVRRLSAGTEPATRAGKHDLGSTANNV